MDERLTDEQLQAIRERREAVKATALKEHEARQALEQDGSAAEKYCALINAEFEWEDARRRAEAFADEDIEALLAHIDALHALLGNLVDGIDECWASLPDNQLHIDTLENITGKRVKRDS